MQKTKIEWAEFTVNPLRAWLPAAEKAGHYCEKISPGCRFCYASRLQRRFGLPSFPGAGAWAKLGDRTISDDERIALPGGLQGWLDMRAIVEPSRRRTPATYFWADMTDLFGEWWPDRWREIVVLGMAAATRHTHFVLTKRPEALAAMAAAAPWFAKQVRFGDARRTLVDWTCSYQILPNIRWGVSVENQAQADARGPILARTPAACRFLSVEPLLGPVSLGPLLKGDRIDWVIVGGESGPAARPCSLGWIRAVVEDCRAAGVPCFVKQLGANPRPDYSGPRLQLVDRKGGDPSEWPDDLRVREFPRFGAA